ncbi:hypothetical protein [Massilia glaciei]|uniref:Uncharacterized protein n=1 Tax=Massilia glaciei TaxID=1524097 RepID=A0A2U2HIS3_9BURK|nr:hypothetical protein [Massilia glaciei]PWF46695.1 hypothetical protein C7C56_015765 [Massilia glaciei]
MKDVTMTRLFLRLAACAALVASSALSGCAAPDPSRALISKQAAPEYKNGVRVERPKSGKAKENITIADSEEFRRQATKK